MQVKFTLMLVSILVFLAINKNTYSAVKLNKIITDIVTIIKIYSISECLFFKFFLSNVFIEKNVNKIGQEIIVEFDLFLV